METEKGRRESITERLEPGGAIKVLTQVSAADLQAYTRQLIASYALYYSINSAMRDRAADHSRSADRGDVPSASAVSSIVKPAK